MLNDDINLNLAVFAFPFVNIDILFNDCFEKYYIKGSVEIEDKAVIREKLVKYLKNKYYLSSYDEAYLFLDKWYLYPRMDNERKRIKQHIFDMIWKHLKCFETSFISQRDGKIVYKYWENEDDARVLGGFSKSNKIYLFHSMNRLIPTDILTIIYLVRNGKNIQELKGYYGNIAVSDTLLDRILEKGVAENHLHGGVAVSFLSNWDYYMKPLTESVVVDLRKLDRTNTGYENITSSENTFLLMFANLLRTLIVIKLYFILIGKEETEEVKELTDCFIRTLNGNLDEEITCWCKDDEPIIAFSKKINLIREQFRKEIVDLKDLFIWKNNKEIDGITDENVFLYEMVSFIENKELKVNEELATVMKMFFLNYLRIKNHFYQLVVQQKTIHGLNFFQSEFYEKNSSFSKQAIAINKNNKWNRAIKEQLQDVNIRKLELRTSIDNTETDFRKEVNDFLSAYLDVLHNYYCGYCVKENKYKPIKKFPKVGLVFHFIKKEQKYSQIVRGTILREKEDYLQYMGLYIEYKKQLKLLHNLRNNNANKFPFDKYLVGIDVASLENEVPTWVFTAVYENARDSKSEPINKPKGRIHQSLGFTFHAGEDFRHIISGLRRIHEVIIHLKFHAGDRIGHGVALGIDPKKWEIQNKTIIIPRVELLENYLWAYDLLSNYCDESSVINLDYLEKTIHKIAEEIYGEGINVSVNTLLKAYRGLFKMDRNLFEESEEFFDEMNDKVISFMKDKATQFSSEFWQYTRQSNFFAHKMNEPIHVKIEEQEVEITKIIQSLVKKAVDEKGVIVEINPSSNVVIADIDTIDENQVYGINNYGYHFDNLIVCINSDDPSVFNTNVANELGYIYFGMLEKNSNREAALSWIDKLRENGMSASFIRGDESDEQTLKELEEYVNSL